MSSWAMGKAERERFLAGIHVGVLSVAMGEGRGPLTVPVWYDYTAGGQVSVITGRSTRKGLAIRAAGRMSLCAQDENPPYRYVSVEGPVAIEELELDERIAMARRYLGADGADQYLASSPDPAGEMMMFRMTPEHWLAVDYSERAPAS
jgi:nitroimidazol reductase NimA-like FMN-containing flavoprotein (pyridoxamine 5'-phosphate oxidase superfamily)